MFRLTPFLLTLIHYHSSQLIIFLDNMYLLQLGYSQVGNEGIKRTIAMREAVKKKK
jgi:hypothetical protein